MRSCGEVDGWIVIERSPRNTSTHGSSTMDTHTVMSSMDTTSAFDDIMPQATLSSAADFAMGSYDGVPRYDSEAGILDPDSDSMEIPSADRRRPYSILNDAQVPDDELPPYVRTVEAAEVSTFAAASSQEEDTEPAPLSQVQDAVHLEHRDDPVPIDYPTHAATSSINSLPHQTHVDQAIWTCPVCLKPQPPNNSTFNTHLDACLNQAVVLDAMVDHVARPVARWLDISARNQDPDRLKARISVVCDAMVGDYAGLVCLDSSFKGLGLEHSESLSSVASVVRREVAMQRRPLQLSRQAFR